MAAKDVSDSLKEIDSKLDNLSHRLERFEAFEVGFAIFVERRSAAIDKIVVEFDVNRPEAKYLELYGQLFSAGCFPRA